MDIDWYDLDIGGILAEARRLLGRDPDADDVEEAVEILYDIGGGYDAEASLSDQLVAVELMVDLASRQIELSEQGRCDDLTALDFLVEWLDDDVQLGPAVERVCDVLLQDLARESPWENLDDCPRSMWGVVLTEAQAARALAIAADRADPDDGVFLLSLRALAARGHRAQEDDLIAFLHEHADVIPWGDDALLAALVQMRERAAPFLERVAMADALDDEDIIRVLGDAILPHLKAHAPEREDLIQKIESPWEDLEGTFLCIADVLPRAPALWPDVVELLRDEPDLLQSDHPSMQMLLVAVAYCGCPAGDLLPRLVEIGVSWEAWLTLLRLGVAAKPAMAAGLEDEDLDEDSVGLLRQVIALLG